jgi:hypothetical protein
MSTNFNRYLQEQFSECNRIVITASGPFNPKNKNSIEALANIRDPGDIELAKSLLGVDSDAWPSWMSPVDIYLNFMQDKSLISSVGIVLGGWLRSPEWNGDYALVDHQAFHRWLVEHHVIYTQHQK